MNLYNIKLEYLRVMEMIEDAEGEVTNDISDALDQITDNKEELISSMLQEIVNEKASEMALKAEIERLAERKNAIIDRQERLKQVVIDTLKYFDMRSANKNSRGYAFKNAMFSCFTVSRKSYKLDDLLLGETFKPITGKTSKFVNYSVDCKLDAESLAKVNATGVVPETSYGISVDKKALNTYLADIAEGKQLEFDDEQQIVTDPIVEFATLVVKDSLTIR